MGNGKNRNRGHQQGQQQGQKTDEAKQTIAAVVQSASERAAAEADRHIKDRHPDYVPPPRTEPPSPAGTGAGTPPPADEAVIQPVQDEEMARVAAKRVADGRSVTLIADALIRKEGGFNVKTSVVEPDSLTKPQGEELMHLLLTRERATNYEIGAVMWVAQQDQWWSKEPGCKNHADYCLKKFNRSLSWSSNKVGVYRRTKLLRSLGIDEELPEGVSNILGSLELHPEEFVRAYWASKRGRAELRLAVKDQLKYVTYREEAVKQKQDYLPFEKWQLEEEPKEIDARLAKAQEGPGEG